MSHSPHPARDLPAPSATLQEGWHCLHLYYRVNQANYAQLTVSQRETGRQELIEILRPDAADAPVRLQTSVVAGHRADLSLMLMDSDPFKLERLRQKIRSSALGVVLEPTYSFVSITEISEYVPTIEQFSERLIREGAKPDDPAFIARVNGYKQRLPMMNQQRLCPDFPDWPVMCFYPMNKSRHPQANWYEEPFSVRSALMAEHATSGIAFAGKVSQLITASTGLDDWEWGVTLWGRNPAYLKDIVYTMRFDTASAHYAEFGPFYTSYILDAKSALDHLRL